MSWSLFVGVALIYVLTYFLPTLNIIVVPVGLGVALFVLIFDAFSKNLLVKAQLFKLFLYCLLGVSFGEVYEMPVVSVVFAILAGICTLTGLIMFIRRHEDVSQEADKINQEVT